MTPPSFANLFSEDKLFNGCYFRGTTVAGKARTAAIGLNVLRGFGFDAKMIKSAAFGFMDSFAPCHSFVLKSHGRVSVNKFLSHSGSWNGCGSTNTRKCQLHMKPAMSLVANHPPLFSVAPMMEWTDNHYRTLARLISKHAWLYTEMIASQTLIHQTDNLDRFLAYSPQQHPIVLQIGGSEVGSLAEAAKLAQAYRYDEINLNCGCPSPRVAGHGCFGVTLMLNPKLVGEAMSVIADNSDVPVSVKCRIGVDDHDSYNELCEFIYKVSSLSPTRHFVIHSRKALLNGISPSDNRKIPPLRYEYFYALLRDFPDLRFTINGGITSIDGVNAALKAGAHGVMVGRAAYNNPWQILGPVDSLVYGELGSAITRRQVLEKYQLYADSVLGQYGPFKPSVRVLVKPLLGLFHSEPGNGQWKRSVDAAFNHCTTVKSLLEEALVAIPDHVLDATPTESPSSSEDPFDAVHDLLPPPYVLDKELLYAQ